MGILCTLQSVLPLTDRGEIRIAHQRHSRYTIYCFWLSTRFIERGDVVKKKLYVGNLSFETTESDLKELFEQTGAVETVRIITDPHTGRSTGFGFVEMQEGGDNAIAQMNGKEFNGRKLTVNDARPMPGLGSGSGFKRY